MELFSRKVSVFVLFCEVIVAIRELKSFLLPSMPKPASAEKPNRNGYNYGVNECITSHGSPRLIRALPSNLGAALRPRVSRRLWSVLRCISPSWPGVPRSGGRPLQVTVVPPYQKGPRTRFTARVFLRVIKRIETGSGFTQACRAEGLLTAGSASYANSGRLTRRVWSELSEPVPNFVVMPWSTLCSKRPPPIGVPPPSILERVHCDSYALKNVIRHDGKGNNIRVDICGEKALRSLRR
jgi:hypothetical protein